MKHGLKVSDEFKIYGADVPNAFTVQKGVDAITAEDGLDIVVKKILDDNHFCFEYKSTVGSIFGNDGDEPGHFISVITRNNTNLGLGFDVTNRYYTLDSTVGLTAILKPDYFLSAMGRIQANDYRQWSSFYTNLTVSTYDNGTSTGSITPTHSEIDYSGLSNYDCRVTNSMSKEISVLFDIQALNNPTTIVEFDYFNFKPVGLVPLQGESIDYIYDPHALVTVGPRGAFIPGEYLPHDPGSPDLIDLGTVGLPHALSYLNYKSDTERSQIMSIVDVFRRFRKNRRDLTTNGYLNSGTLDSNSSMFIRGNDIDQQNPNNMPTITVTENYTGAANQYKGGARYFIQNIQTQAEVTAATTTSPYIITIEEDVVHGHPSPTIVTDELIKNLPYSGYATMVGPNNPLIKWTSIDESNNKLLGVTIENGTYPVAGFVGHLVKPMIFPIICNAQAIFTPPVARQARQQYRVAHASYMHDIASSMWFRMVFGIIEPRAAGTHGPPHWASAREANSLFTSWTHPLLTGTVGSWWGINNDGEWTYETISGGSPALYGTQSQYTETFTLTEDYDPATDTTFTISQGTPPLIDTNFKDRRWIDKGSRIIDNGTDPTISIPSRAWTLPANQSMDSGGLVFEIDNTDGTLDVGAARSCRMTTCTDDTDEQYTHWEIVRVKQGEIRNMLNSTNNEWVLPSESQGKAMPGPIWLTAAHDPADYDSAAEVLYDTTDEKDPDFFHSGDPKAVSGSRMFASLKVGDIVFVGNTQGTKVQDVTNVINEEFNVDNPYGEERDFVSYRWYIVIEKKDGGANTSLYEETNSAIAIFPAEYAYCDHNYRLADLSYPHKHPVGMAETLEETTTGFVGWVHKLVRGSAINPNQAELPSGFPTVKSSITKLYSGNIQVSGVKHLTESHAAGTKGRFRYIRNNFNHIWLNWADMRNDGSADADGGRRKAKFGLIYPTEDAYSVDMIFSKTQSDIIQLKIGSDVDLWELTGTDPFTGAAWSENYTNNQTGYEHLHDWESKAGAPMAVDASKYFNINTMANNGKVGQLSGGMKIIADYELTQAGEAAIMDNYWWQAGAHPYTAKYRHPYDPNWQFYVRYETKLAQSTMSNKPVFLIDSSNVYQGLHFTDWVNAGIIEAKPENATDDSIETFTYKMGGCFVSHYDETITSTATRLYLDFGAEKLQEDMAISTSMEATNFYSNNIGTIDSTREHTVFNNWSSIMGLGAMLAIGGYVSSKGCNTYYEHDKIRLLWQTHTVQSWLSGSDLPCSYDINNVPISIFMDYGQQGGSSSIDSYGSTIDGRGKTTLGMIRLMRVGSGNGDGETYTAFNYLIGRDNRFEFRPSYGSGLTLDRNNLSSSNIETEARAQFTHVRAFYNNGESFVDAPTPILDGSQTKWKILNAFNTSSLDEAKALANYELEKVREKEVKVRAELIGDGTNTNSMFDGGLYGYISTPLIQCCSAVSSTSSATNYGALFPTSNLTGTIIGGRVNAIDGNLDATNSNYIGEQRSMEYLESGNGYHGGGGCNTYDTHATDWYGQFTPYGISSIEKAIQIVHIPKGVPKVSNTTGQKLRMFITHASDVANEGKFRIWLIDSHFDSQRRQGYTGNNPLTSAGISNLDVEGNGFFEIAFPSSYGAGSLKMVVSFNREYCIDLLKYRSNNSNLSKSNRGNRITTLPSTSVSILDLSHGNSVNEASAFPLGLSLYYRPYGSEDSQGRQGPLWQLRPRSLYYAPQIEIVDDFVWRVGRTVTYIDNKLNLNENLTITGIIWKQSKQKIEFTELQLQKDESQSTQFLGLGVGTAPISPPSTSPPTNDSGGGIGDWTLPGDYDDGAPGWGGLKPPEDRGGIGSEHSVDESLSPTSRQHSISGAPDQQGGSGKGATMSGSKIGVNRMSRGATNAIKGTSDLLLEIAEGESGLLGINRNRSASKQTSKITSKEAMGQTKHTGSGSAMLSEEGFTLPGISKIPDGSISQADYHESSVIITVPQAVSSNRVSVVANVIAPSTGGGSKYTLFCALECIETGFKQNRAIDITANDSAQRIVLFSTRSVDGANTSGNRIRIIIGRVPGGGSMTEPDGADDSPMASLTVKGIEIMFNESALNQSTGKKTMTSKMTTNDNTKGWMTETSNAWQSKTSDANYDEAGNITYLRRGKRGSNVLRKEDGAGGYSEDEL